MLGLNDLVLRVKSRETSASGQRRGDRGASAKEGWIGRRQLRCRYGGVGYGERRVDPVTGHAGRRNDSIGGRHGGHRRERAEARVQRNRDRDRDGNELSEKGLRRDLLTAPVSGYVYFPIAEEECFACRCEYVCMGIKVVVALRSRRVLSVRYQCLDVCGVRLLLFLRDALS